MSLAVIAAAEVVEAAAGVLEEALLTWLSFIWISAGWCCCSCPRPRHQSTYKNKWKERLAIAFFLLNPFYTPLVIACVVGKR